MLRDATARHPDTILNIAMNIDSRKRRRSLRCSPKRDQSMAAHFRGQSGGRGSAASHAQDPVAAIIATQG
ncbi:hypothetical protein [Reyranella sp.]|uniref:hypothetical protein n=1 Tax=Reyranella sp. TaxID=1929291 RepID=UPI003BA89FFC